MPSTTRREDKAELPRAPAQYDDLPPEVNHLDSMGMGVIVAKRPRASASSRAREATPAADFDRDAILAKLFALPFPPDVAGFARQYPTHTPLGRVMRLRRLMIRDVERMDGCPNSRRMSDYLAGRVEIIPRHRAALARGLGVDARLL